jgi:3D (Asp-Asp-Asp) domain-containing protein
MRMVFWSVALGSALMIFGALSMASAQSAAEASKFQFPAPSELPKDALRRLYATAYFVQPAMESNDTSDPVILGPSGESLGIRIRSSIWCRAAVEGSLTVHKLNGAQQGFKYSGVGNTKVTDCKTTLAHMDPTQVIAIEKSTFRPTDKDAPYGVGACDSGTRYRLVPHRSIAIDARANAPLAVGQIVFIARLRGAKIMLPDGTQKRHDGYVMAADTGGSIKGKHIDYFKGPAANDHVPPALAPKDEMFDAYLITAPDVLHVLKQAHVMPDSC